MTFSKRHRCVYTDSVKVPGCDVNTTFFRKFSLFYTPVMTSLKFIIRGAFVLLVRPIPDS
jgi:hypothetical protein